MTNPYRAMCAEILTLLDLYEDGERVDWDAWRVRARALLAQPVAEGPTDEELEKLAEPFSFVGEDGWTPVVYDEANYARAVLARWGRPTPQPVAVSERLPGPEDCDEQGRCWLGGDQLASGSPTWILGYPDWASRFPDVHYRWLPANALPLPAGEGAS